jgi:hypothetical protein
MTKQIAIEHPQVGKVAVSITEADTCIFATAGDLTCEGNLNLLRLMDELKAAIQKELSSQLRVHLKFGNVTSTGDVTF